MATLAELRARSARRPKPKHFRTVTLVEGQHLLAQSQRLTEELVTIMAKARGVDENGERTGPPRKAGQGAELGPRAEEIKQEQVQLVADLAEFQGEVELTGFTGGEWQLFKDENPARDENAADLKLTAGLCDSSALFAQLGRFVTSWNGEELSEGDWDSWLADSIIYADRRDLVTDVVAMHEDSVVVVPKSSSSSSTTASSETA